jgi:pimeloyl-ACP methyl ester carboxylesterase
MRGVAEHGARVGFAASPSGPLRYAVRGPEGAQPLLLLHGLGDSLAGWAQVAGPLAERFRVHLLDLPGHGLSARPPDWRLQTLLAAVEHYAAALPEPIVVGHSLGGWLALRLALDARLARPRGLVLVNPGGALLDDGAWAPFRALVSARDRKDVERYLAAAFYKPPLALRLLPGEVIKAMWADGPQGVLDAVVAGDFVRDAELAALRLPLRVVWGTADRLLPAGSLDFFRRNLPNAELVLLERAGHLPHLEAPRALARAIAAPLGRGDEAPRSC